MKSAKLAHKTRDHGRHGKSMKRATHLKRARMARWNSDIDKENVRAAPVPKQTETSNLVQTLLPLHEANTPKPLHNWLHWHTHISPGPLFHHHQLQLYTIPGPLYHQPNHLPLHISPGLQSCRHHQLPFNTNTGP